MQQIVAELGLKHGELESVKEEIISWESHKESGKAGVLSFSVRSVTSVTGKEVDASSIAVQVQIDGVEAKAVAGDSVPEGVFGVQGAKAVADTFTFALDTLDISLKVTCHENSVKDAAHAVEGGDAAEKVGEEEAVGTDLAAELSVRSVPYVALFDARSTPSNTTERRDIEAVCSESGDIVILSVNSLFDRCDNALASKMQEAAQIKASIEELESILKEGAAKSAQEEAGAASKSSAGADGGAEADAPASTAAAPKKEKKQKKSKVAASQGFSVAQAGQFAVAALVEYRSYWLFGGAALAIFFGGDNASV
jgi:hypothetical protein